MASAKKPGMSGIQDPSVTWVKRPLAELDLAGRTAAVVGGTNGLGRAIALSMAARGARVIVVGRTFRDAGVKGLEHVSADLASMREAARIGRELPAGLDVVVLTTGILAAPTREQTAEGLERDMAVSFLSRLALLRELAPRLVAARGARRPRVFVMGFPGTGQVGTQLDDWNAERAYDAMAVHMNTVAGNEALVLDAKQRYPELDVFGLNPGLVKTGIRANYLGEGSLKHRLAETLIGLFTPTPKAYGERTVPLLFAPELERRSGAMFHQKGHAILPTPELVGGRAGEIVAASEALVARALAAPAG
jgi:NAD(P)-dependent dehydrogenase (short-subunit alcohol dehydrogenase family)